jgi:hypothetical protein
MEQALKDELFFWKKRHGNALPKEYTQIKGITFGANTYYEITGFKLTGADTLRFSFSATKACNVLGCYTTTDATTNYSLYVTTTSGNYMRYDGGTASSKITVNQRYDVIMFPTGAIGLGSQVSWTQKEFTAVSDLCIGTTSTTASSSKLDGKLFGNIKVDGKLLLIPCVRNSDDEVGYYDAIGKKFYEPTGSTPTPITT